MPMNKHQKLRLQEFNDFDIERLLKGVIDSLADENSERLNTLELNRELFDDETVAEFGEIIENNSAEIIKTTSILTHTDDVYSYFTGGPLFRKDRDVK